MTAATNREEGPRPLLLLLSDRINDASECFLFFLMLLMIAVTTLQVVCRFFFTALAWSEELTCFLLVLASLVGAACAFKRGSHMAVTFLVQRLPQGLQRLLALLVHILGVTFFAVVAWYGAALVRSEGSQTTPALGISMSWVYLMYPLFGSIIILHLLSGLLTLWKAKRLPQEE